MNNPSHLTHKHKDLTCSSISSLASAPSLPLQPEGPLKYKEHLSAARYLERFPEHVLPHKSPQAFPAPGSAARTYTHTRTSAPQRVRTSCPAVRLSRERAQRTLSKLFPDTFVPASSHTLRSHDADCASPPPYLLQRSVGTRPGDDRPALAPFVGNRRVALCVYLVPRRRAMLLCCRARRASASAACCSSLWSLPPLLRGRRRRTAPAFGRCGGCKDRNGK